MKDEIRVLHLADAVNRYDFIDNVVRHVSRDCFDVAVATFEAEANILAPNYAEIGIPHFSLNCTAKASYALGVARLARIFRTWKPDIVHAHHFDPNVLAWAAARLDRKVAIVVGRHYSDAIYLNSSGWRRSLRLYLEEQVNSNAAGIVSPSSAIQDLLVLRQGVAPRKVRVVPYAFDPARYPPISAAERARTRDELGLHGHFAIATVGRLYRDKGHRYLAQALHILAGQTPDLLWLIVGDGPDRASLEALVKRGGVDSQVRFLGWRKDAIRIMGCVDSVVQPSLQEAYSQAMVEALWMSAPLVMTRVSGAEDLLTDGETALLVPPSDVEALVAAVQRLHGDPTLRAKLSSQGRAHVAATLCLSVIVPRMEDLYRQVMDEPKR